MWMFLFYYPLQVLRENNTITLSIWQHNIPSSPSKRTANLHFKVGSTLLSNLSFFLLYFCLFPFQASTLRRGTACCCCYVLFLLSSSLLLLMIVIMGVGIMLVISFCVLLFINHEKVRGTNR